MPRLSKIGAAALAAFGWTGLNIVSASYLVVAGGAGGGGTESNYNGAGGGGAGGFQTGTTSLNPLLSYAVTVGAGGAGGTISTIGVNGSNSQLGALTASVGGGGGGTSSTTSANRAGANGGSGGGGAGDTPGGISGGTGTSGQGNAGGSGFFSGSYGGGGGGGASAVGQSASAASGNGGGNGGAGTASSISGSSVTYAGGGAGGMYSTAGSGNPGTGGAGGGGNGGTRGGGNGFAGTVNLGGGGGGATTTSGSNQIGGNGGSGVVIISYVGAQQFGGGVVTSSGGNTIHTFNTSGTLSPLSSLTASTLVVAGGGGGGFDRGGGGGAGGLRTSSGTTIDTNSVYLVTVGAGGSGSSSGANKGSSGSDSVFLSITSTGGGGGGSGSNAVGANGGSGGGSRDTSSGGAGSGNTPSTSPSQGNNGGSFGDGSGSTGGGGGGGGAGAVGNAGKTVGTGIGGAGTASSISGTSTTYAGGGGGGGGSTAGGAAGGSGGGGAGGNANSAGTAGTANLGSGGGGGGDSSGNGGSGGSGVVIISYPGSTQQMAGGTVTVAGGNVIHTFTSSGYLTPIVLVNNSLRFRRSVTAYLNRTPSVASDRRTYTWSGWVKLGTLSVARQFFGTTGGSTQDALVLSADNQLVVFSANASETLLRTAQLFRDPSAWYHIVVAVDTTQATSSNRVKIYVNGVQVTAFEYTQYPSPNYQGSINNNVIHYISTYDGSNWGFDGYLADVNFIDGQALTPNSFGSFNGLGVWQPIRYGGSYGTNGFYLPFTNTTSTTTLGLDFSPNGNNWTTNNISLTAGSTYDSMTDVPTLTSATVANYATFNPLISISGSNYSTLSNGNLTTVGNSAANNGVNFSTQTIKTGKWYAEFTCTGSSGSYPMVGINDITQITTAATPGYAPNSVGYIASGQKTLVNGTQYSYGNSFTTNDVIGVAVDADNGAVYFGKQTGGTGSIVWQNSGDPTSGASKTGAAYTYTGGTIEFYIAASPYQSGTGFNANFGQQPFSATPPTGFLRLNTFNLPTPTIGATASTTANKYFNANLYTGNGTTNAITNVGFQPDFVWVKSISDSYFHGLYDAVRGAGSTKGIYSNDPVAEGTYSDYQNLVSFDSNGFTLGATSNTNNINANTSTFVGWNWKANGAGSTNTAGSIISTVSSNTATGFSIVTYTGNATSGATVGHGCQVNSIATAPSMVILKSRSLGTNFYVYHSGLTSAAYQVYLNLPSQQDNSVTTAFNSVAPGATTFTLPGTGFGSNNSGATYVAYCFAQVAGYSAFGTYIGNNDDNGPFIYTGFRPRWVMVKNRTSSQSWQLMDTSRSTYNVATANLLPNSSTLQLTGTDFIDILSNGFKIRRNSAGNWNNSGDTYLYVCFAENPFKYANAR
jgi:hypothetical protein